MSVWWKDKKEIMDTKTDLPKKDVKSPFPYKDSLYNGVLMTVGILGSTYIVKNCFGKKYAPDISTNQLVTLGVVTILSRFGIDFIKREKLITREW